MRKARLPQGSSRASMFSFSPARFSRRVAARLAALSFLLACFVSTQTRAADLPPQADILAGDIAGLRLLVDRSLDWRARASAFIEQTDTRIKNDVLTAADLSRLYAGAREYVMLRRRWQALIDLQGPEAWSRPAETLRWDALARLQTKLALAAALMQHDDYRLGVDPFFQRRKIRRLLKSDHPAVEGEVHAAVLHFLNPVTRARLARAVVWHCNEGLAVADRSDEEIFLDEIITQSAGYAFFTRSLAERALINTSTGTRAAITFVTDLIDQVGRGLVNTTSLVVGNTVGLVETRKGYLLSLSDDERTALASRLRPLDVLLEKTPFRLTDKSIPGHYGHVAIWIGTEEELRELDLWDHPLVRPHHERIRNGAHIVEALRPGVRLNPLESFLNIDDLLVLRRRELTLEQTRESLLLAFAQIGKAYDFNFDVESDRRIVCSELAFIVFPHDPWPTSRVLGRASITPDQVATKARPDGLFEPVILFHDGVEIQRDLPATLCCLLDATPNAFAGLHPDFKGRSR